MKILIALNGTTSPPNRFNDLKILKLPANLEFDIKQSIESNKMLWEPWTEGVETFEDLRKSLKKRGYSNIPHYPYSDHQLVAAKVSKNKIKPHATDVKIDKPNTMIR